MQKQFSCKKTYIFFEKLLFTMFFSLVYILNNFFHSVFSPLDCIGSSKKFKIYRNLQSVTSTMFTRFLITVHFIVQLGSVRKCLKVLLKFFGICPPVFPSNITAMACLSYSFPSSGYQYKFSPRTFGVSIRPYMRGILEQRN